MSMGALWGSISFACATIALTACGDSHGGSGGAGTGTTSASTGLGGGETAGCSGVKLLSNPSDTSKPGPWAVGVKTASVSGLTVEVWYPADASASVGKTQVEYDVRSWLPPSEMGKISDAKAPKQTCDCFRDLPLDAAHGPYPVVVFVHGTAGFRTQSLELVTHWASRGFVVVSADHPGLVLTDLISSVCGGAPPPKNLDADVKAEMDALAAPSADLAFLAGHIDLSKVAMIGHSAGGAEVAKMGDVADVVIPMAAGGPTGGARLRSTLIMGAKDDKVVPFSNQQSGYDAAPKPKRLVGISPAGHLTFSSLCSIRNADGEDIVTIGKAASVCGLSLAGALFDCLPTYLDAKEGFTIVDDATSAVLEETLHCAPERAAWFSLLQSRYPEVDTLQEDR